MIKAVLVKTFIRPLEENTSEFREQPCSPNFQCLDVKTLVWISSDIWAKLSGTPYLPPPSCLFTCPSPPSSSLLKLLEGGLLLSCVWISHWQAPSAQIIPIPQRESAAKLLSQWPRCSVPWGSAWACPVSSRKVNKWRCNSAPEWQAGLCPSEPQTKAGSVALPPHSWCFLEVGSLTGLF